jgi:hypothetical protein
LNGKKIFLPPIFYARAEFFQKGFFLTFISFFFTLMDALIDELSSVIPYNETFFDSEKAVAFLRRHNVSKTINTCFKCSSKTHMNFNSQFVDKYVFRCLKQDVDCVFLLGRISFLKIKVEAKKVLRVIWCWFYNSSNHLGIALCE